jgi:DNA-binding CsgD family transcriptional regulator
VLTEDDLRSNYGLTPSEIRLTLRLAAGLTLREVAGALGISYQTARTKLKFVFRKTGVRRQTQLILLVARGASERKTARSRSAATRRLRGPPK